MQGAQNAVQQKLAEDMFHSLAPSLGPLLSLPSDFATTHVSCTSGLFQLWAHGPVVDTLLLKLCWHISFASLLHDSYVA